MRGVLLTLVTGLCLALAACRTHDYRRAMIAVPEMKNQAAADLISRALDRIPGVRMDKVVLDVNRRRVTVVYDSLEVALKNIEFVIREAGFTANDIPARPEAAAALPPEVTGMPSSTGATNPPPATPTPPAAIP